MQNDEKVKLEINLHLYQEEFQMKTLTNKNLETKKEVKTKNDGDKKENQEEKV